MSDFKHYRQLNKIKGFYSYHPLSYRGSFNPTHDEMSRMIIALKDKNMFVIEAIVKNIIDKLPLVDVVCSVPSSDAEETENGIRLASKLIAQKLDVIDGTGCLYRTATRQRSCSGNRLDMSSHLSTLDVKDMHLIMGKNVLLLDDVTTSGRTIVACAKVLTNAGAKSIYKYAIGETVYYGR